MVAEEERFAQMPRRPSPASARPRALPSGKALASLADVHSELRRLRELSADRQALDELDFGAELTADVRAALANEWWYQRQRVTDALAACGAALANKRGAKA